MRKKALLVSMVIVAKSARRIWLIKRLLAFLLFVFGNSYVFAQSYKFVSYDIADGLAQSQVLVTYQDDQHYLWFGTYGGVSRFDGKEFRSFTKADGLLNNVVTSVLKDRFGKVWLGTEAGLSCLEGNKIRTVTVPMNDDKSWIRNLIEDSDGQIWFTKKSKLYFIGKSGIREQQISGKNEYVVSLNKTKTGETLAAVCGSGIYSREKQSWALKVKIADSILITKVIPDRLSKDSYFLLSPNKIYKTQGGKYSAYSHPLLDGVEEPFLSMETDADGTLWVGTNNGAYYLHKSEPVHFNSENGFTDNAVTSIYRDTEDNIWLSSDGAGVFKFEGGSFKRFDHLNGQNHIVMSMAKDASGKLWLGSFNSGLLTYEGKKFVPQELPSETPYSRNIMSLAQDKEGEILVGSQNGLWRKTAGGFVLVTKNQMPQIVRNLMTDQNGIIWMAAPGGCFYLDSEGRSRKVAGLKFSGSALAPIGRDSVLLGTNSGVYLIKNKSVDTRFNVPALKNTSVLCLLKYGNKVLAGTFGDGLFLIDLISRTAVKYNVRNGLLSNDIYSLGLDKNGVIWAGTGRGINRLKLDHKRSALIVQEEITPTALTECNQNSMLLNGNAMWIGTTKGLYVFNTDKRSLANKVPYINIQSLKIFNQEIVDGKQRASQIFVDRIPKGLKLNSYQNRIAISFRGIYFTNPDKVLYQYRLLGIADEFSLPVRTNTIEYTSLLPGTYVFEVKALVGGRQSQVIRIPFEITPPFYNTIWFRVLMFLILIFAIIGGQAYLNKLRLRKKLLVDAIKQEEQQKIRKQTAEDFHDDIGNKLTRISILSDILNKKIGNDQSEQKVILQQIKDDASTLYSGTKEILWALDPQSDNLYEILDHIRHTGTEVFENTGIRYSFGEIDQAYRRIKLPMEYSRNISMIFKEILSNILKHAQAREVAVAVEAVQGGVSILVSDDGVGFHETSEHKGHGLKNIRMRVRRVNGTIQFNSTAGNGTTARLFIDLEQLNY